MTLSETRVNLEGGGYPVRTGNSLPALLASLPADLRARVGAVVIDERVWALHRERIEAALTTAGISGATTRIPGGESAKTLERYATLCRFLATGGVDRHTVVLALGGGVVTDLAGFAAATFARGVSWVACPTTVLGMVDAAVGGKTGINFEGAKNVLGAFHQPMAVLADVSFLPTLDPRDFVSGLAEAVKAAVIRDAGLFERMERDPDVLRDPRHPDLPDLLHQAMAVKAAVVEADEREAGERAVLNFGHTFGHALEAATGFGQWTHGEAVSIGMVCAAAASVDEAGLSEEAFRRVEGCLLGLGLPVRDPNTAPETLTPWLERDKKGVGGTPRFVLTPRIGSASFGHQLPQVYVAKTVARFIGSRAE